MFVVYILILIAGFAALIKGADLFVDGSSALARRFRVPSLIIGLTIVAMGTSAPELAVSISAAIRHSNEIALSNVIGSNMFNLLAVLGVCAVLNPLAVNSAVLRRDLPVSMLAALLVFAFCGAFGAFRLPLPAMSETVGTISRPLAALLLALFLIYNIVVIHVARRSRGESVEEAFEKRSLASCIGLILLGLALIIAGGQAVVRSAEALARALGMSETLIGLTVVAVGTSLPELVTSIVAARKGEAELAVGNAVGSCIFNMLLIIGVSALINPISVNLASLFDLCILIFASLVTLVFAFTGKTIHRGEGAIMLLLYAASVVFAILR